MQESWGSTEFAYLDINAHDPIIVTPELRAYMEVRRQTTCDEEDRFRFEGLVDGDCVVTTSVT